MGAPPLGTPADATAVRSLRRLDGLERLSPLEGRRLLDVGCGNGVYTLRMAERFEEVHAIDVVDDHLAQFRARLEAGSNIAVEKIDAIALPWPDDYFDVVTAIEVIEHIDGIGAALAEIRRVLTPDGRLFVAVPNRWYPFETHGIFIRGRYRGGQRLPFLPWIPPLHDRLSRVQTFTPRTLRALLTGADFEMSRPEYVMPPFDRSEAGARWIRPLTDALERTPARRFGVSLLVCAKPIRREPRGSKMEASGGSKPQQLSPSGTV